MQGIQRETARQEQSQQNWSYPCTSRFLSSSHRAPGQLSARCHSNSGSFSGDATGTLRYKSSWHADAAAGQSPNTGASRMNASRDTSGSAPGKSPGSARGSANGKGSTGEERGYSQHHSTSNSNNGGGGPTYTAALIKRQAAAALHKAGPAAGRLGGLPSGSNAGSSPQRHVAGGGTAMHHTGGNLGALAAQLLGSSCTPAAATGGLTIAGTAQLSARASNARRHSSGGGSSAGGYAAKAGSHSQKTSARRSCSAADDVPAAGVSGTVAYPTQQVSCALSALEAITSANTAAAAMLRAVASEAARSASSRNAGLAAASAAANAAGEANKSEQDASNWQPVVPPLSLLQSVGCQQQEHASALGHKQQQEQPLAQQLLLQRQALGAGGCLYQTLDEPPQQQARASSSAGDQQSCAAAAAASHPAQRGLQVSTGDAVDALEAECSSPGGIGYSNLRRLQASCSGALVAASPRTQLMLQQQRVQGLSVLPELPADSRRADSCSVLLPQRLLLMQQLQQQHEAEWASKDMVTSWYHAAADDDEDDDTGNKGELQSGSCGDNNAKARAGPPMPAAAAAAAAPATVTTHLSPRLRLLATSSTCGSVGLSTAPAASNQALLTTGGGIEYAKLSRGQQQQSGCTQVLPRCNSPQSLHTTANIDLIRQQIDEQHCSSSPSAKLVTGWYSNGLRNRASDCSTRSCGSSSSSLGTGCAGPCEGAAACWPAPDVLELHTTTLAQRCPSASTSCSRWSSSGALDWASGPGNIVPTVPAAAAAAAAVGSGRISSGQSAAAGEAGPLPVGSFDLRPCLPVPLPCAADASVSDLLEASQQQIRSMESTLASMLQVAKRWTDGGLCEVDEGDSLRGRFS